MKKLFLAVIVVIFSWGCNNKKINKESPRAANIDTVKIKISFFPVTAFLKGQMLQFDSLAITPLHTITIKEKTDSEWLKREQLKTLLQPFLSSEINDSNLIQYFEEAKFNDQSLNAITFTYSPIKILPDSINLRNWNVYVDPKIGKVTNIYIVRKVKINNQSITQQLIWQSGKYAQITSILDKPDGNSELLKTEKFIWNFDE